MSSNENLHVRILTLNCWGSKFVSKKRVERIAAIAERLSKATQDYDIVASQEVWVEKDFALLQRSVCHYSPYTKRWYSGSSAGPGLVVFSRWPIESAWIFRFPLNGRPSAFWRGDWYVGKAAGSCVIMHPSGRKIEVVNAHLHAPYAPTGDASYTCHRASQAWDLSGIVSRAIQSGHTVFVTGDLNYRPQSVGLRLFELRAKSSDAWISTSLPLSTVQAGINHNQSKSRKEGRRSSFQGFRKSYEEDDSEEQKSNNDMSKVGDSSAPPASSPPDEAAAYGGSTSRRGSTFADAEISTASSKFRIAQLSPQDQIDLAGVTSDSQLNTWRKHYAPERAKRLDYIFYDSSTATALDAKVVFTEPVPGVGSVSDHFGVTAIFRIHTPSETASVGHSNSAFNTRKHNGLESSKYNAQSETMLDDISQVIDDYKPVARNQAWWRLFHFWMTNSGLVGSLVSVWWGAAKNRAYVGFIYLIAAIVLVITGYTDGLIGFLFGRNEKRALIEFENQVRLAKDFYSRP